MPEVRVRIEKTQDQAGVGNASATGTKEVDKKKIATLSVFANQMVATGKQITNYAVNNIGNFTGNYILQDRVETLVDAVGDAATIGVSLATGNPFAIGAAILGVATKYAIKGVSDYRQDLLAERQREYMLRRSGNATTNGSRGTEN